MKKTKCYIYTRVSTAIQVDGYSLDAQKDKIRKYAEFQDMEIVGEYSDEGHSGKNIKGRPEFMKMLNDIEDGKDEISFVLVFKLSRFGRNGMYTQKIEDGLGKLAFEENREPWRKMNFTCGSWSGLRMPGLENTWYRSVRLTKTRIL